MLGAWCWVVLGWFRLYLYFGLDCVIYGFSRLSPGCKILHFPILHKFYCKVKCKMAGWFYCKFTNPDCPLTAIKP